MAHGVKIEGIEVKEKCHDCFYIHVLHDWTSDLRSRELYKYYTEISSLQSTLPSPVQFKIGPDAPHAHVKCEANLIIFWLKDFELVCRLCVGSQPSVKLRVWLIDWARKIHKCYIKVTLFLHFINTCYLNFLCAYCISVFGGSNWWTASMNVLI